MRIDGQCHCGAVRFEAEIDPEAMSVCHCTDCQVLSGSPFRLSVPAAPASVRMTAQPPKFYVKTGDSGRRRRQYFCPECGSPIYSDDAEDDEGPRYIRWGAIRRRAELRPARQIWCRSAVTWLDAVPQLPGQDTE
ncbi:GFA family protein [Bosea sp. 117]|uniref:GFA family protein n=1 Tax=Bosea sp. 117 TaxID=1125973 RepID=UPI0004943B43|nr:GFA family protein [Bosea sp. 117]